MTTRTTARLSAVGAVTAVALTTGAAALAPTASASVSSISFTTAGTKPVSQATYGWGTVTGGAGLRACTQVLVSGAWQTQWAQCVTTGSTGGYSIRLAYNEKVTGTTTWRVVSGGKVSPTKTLTRTGGSTAPSTLVTGTPNYIKGRTTNGTTLRPYVAGSYAGDNGVKVYLVQTALGMNPGPMDSSLGPVRGSANGSYWLTTITKIKAFQKAKGLPQTGGIDAQTFYAAKDAAPAGALIKSYNFDADSWKQLPTTHSTTHQDKVNAMIAWAKSKMGTRYVWGGTGQVGYDCSGFLLQALRAGGYDPKGVSNLTDVQPPSRLSQALYTSAGLTKVSLNSLKQGDFIYYANSAGLIGHVSMYLDSSHVLNAIGSKVQVSDFSTLGYAQKLGATRMP